MRSSGFLLLFLAASLKLCSVQSLPPATLSLESSTANYTIDGALGSVTRSVKKSPINGYPGPYVPNLISFDDVEYIFNTTGRRVVGICAIEICFDENVVYDENVVNAIQVTYLLSNSLCLRAPSHGKDSCKPFTIKLDVKAKEYVTRVESSSRGSMVTHLTFHTFRPGYERRTFGPFGTPTRNLFSTEGYIIGLYGRYDADVVKTIGAYYLDNLRRSQIYGVQPVDQVASLFDDMLSAQVPPVVGISKIRIWHGWKINAFQVDYLLLSGETLHGEKHGTDGTQPAKKTTIVLKRGEQITKIYGKTDRNYYTYLDVVSFVTKNKRGVLKTYGPFGQGADLYKEIEFSGNVCGFFGSLSVYVYGIGAYYL